MNKAELKRAIELVQEGLQVLSDCINEEAETKESTKEVKETVKTAKKATGAKAVTKPVKSEEEDEITLESLNEMKYNDLKKLGASLGVKCTGSRDEITERILDSVNGESEEQVEDEEPVKPVKGGAKASKAINKPTKKEPEPEEDEEDEFEAQASAILEETEVADVISALKEVGVKATKANVASKLADALREGLLSAEEDGDEEEEELDAEAYYDQYDPEGYNDPESMSEARAEAIVEFIKGVIEQLNSGQIESEDVATFLRNTCNEDELELVDEEAEDVEMFKLYIEMLKRTIDDDGDIHEPSDPYVVNEDHNFCCGHELKYEKKKKSFVCEICGETYKED